jgi:hypothetical protein
MGPGRKGDIWDKIWNSGTQELRNSGKWKSPKYQDPKT